MQDEIDLLCTHGILHLLGYDHAEPEEHATMFGLQDRLLASWRAERGVPPAGLDSQHGTG
jgi:probable rRNA maturation factor